jgi:hypothetical protein
MAGINGIGRISAASARIGNDAAGRILSASKMPNGRINMDAVAAGIAYLVKADPKAAAVATEAIAKQLSPVQRGQLPREISEAVRDQQRAAQTVPRGLNGAQKELMLDLGQIGLDVVGLVDPTPVSDGVNGLISLFRGDFLGAGISAVSMIPYIGDAAKLGKLGKWSKTIDRAIDIARAAPNSAMSKALRPAIDKIADGLNAIPSSVLNKLPASAKKQILEMRAKANAFLNGPAQRPSWRASEQAVGGQLGPTYSAQKSFKNGKEVPYGTKGSSRPDFYVRGNSIEVKNYNISSSAGQRRLIDNVANQAIQRARELPKGTRQSVVIDLRGQKLSIADSANLLQKIVQKSNGALKSQDIKLMR